ncbi:hypothetical protein ACF1BS_04505 [Streptomyces sp. NPDC014748]|uniref:hypothetical protein n=1 Tax=Streptomyces sp. NPDC014748 TaxID=3364905 RepID=UPI003701336F
MPVVLAGLLLGALSAVVTYGMSFDVQLAAVTGGAAVVLTWVGCAYLIAEERRDRP